MVDVAIIQHLAYFSKIWLLCLDEFFDFFNFQFDEIFLNRNTFGG